MRQYLVLAAFVIIGGCKAGKKNNPVEVKIDSNTEVKVRTDTNNTGQPGSNSVGKIDIESFGAIKLGQHYSNMQETLGLPDTKSKAIEWGADGLLHADWTWKKRGLVLNMSSDKANIDSTLSIFSITAKAPCDFKTKAGVGIGSSYADVEAVYKKDIDPEATDKTQITVGSVYGGIIFSFTNDKVTKIFLGAEAE